MRTCPYVILAVVLVGFLFIDPPESGHDIWWRKDLHYLAAEVAVRHVNPFFKVTREEFDHAVDELDKAIPSLKDHEIVVRMMQILAMIGDPHTELGANFSYYPLRLRWFKEGYFVTGTTSAYRQILGSRLVQIGNMDIEKTYAAVKTVIAYDNEGWLRRQSANFLAARAVLHALKILPKMDKGRFVFEDAKKNRFSLEIARPRMKIDASDWFEVPDPTEVPIPLYMKNEGLYYWFEYLRDSKTLYFQYNRCEEMETLPFHEFAEELLDSLDSLSVRRLVIDLRHNSGGKSGVLWPLIAGFKERLAINRKGRFFVLIGSGTYSSAVLNSAELREHTDAIFVGEPTGARPNLYGEYRKFYLPNSGLGVYYSTKYFRMVEDDPPAVMPDVTVEMTATDYFAGRDPVLEKVLAHPGNAVVRN